MTSAAPTRVPLSRTFFDLLRECAERTAGQIALITADEPPVDYGELLRRATATAQALREAGIQRGDRVGIWLPNQVEWLEIFFGAAALGATLVPFSTWSTPRELDFLLRDSGVSTLFTADHFAGRDFAAAVDTLLAPGNHRVANIVIVAPQSRYGWKTYSGFVNDASTLSDVLPPAPGDGASAADTIVVLYTSGSSAHPKAVPLRHYAAIENGFNIGERQGLTRDDKVLVPVPLFWSYGAINALPAIVSHAATMVLQRQFQPDEALDLIERHACTALYTLPAMTNALLSSPGFDRARTASLRTGVTIGAPQDVRRAADDLGAHAICNIYGSTETYGNCAVTWHHWPVDQRSRCQGPPLPGVDARVRDAATGALVGADTVGELEIGGYLTAGYDGKSASNNASAFTADGYFRTGDLASINGAGHIAYAGRSSEMIKRSGINVAPAEIEEVLQELPGVGLAGVTGASHPGLGEQIVAFIVPRRGAALVEADIVGHCQLRLSRYKLPDRIVFRDALPLTPTGKLLRRALRELADD